MSITNALMLNRRKFSQEQAIEFIHQVLKSRSESVSFNLDSKKNAFTGYQNSNKVFELRLPLLFPPIFGGESVESFLDRDPLLPICYSIILIQAEYCALGYFQDGVCVHHKAIRTYVTRRKQGRSQLTYSQSGRKGGTAGSQLRYRNAISFFEKINETLKQWDAANRSERIFYSCPVNLWSFLFNGKVECPFSKSDPRLQKIPLDVRPPNYEELLRVNKIMACGYLSYDNPDLVEQFFSDGTA